MGVLAKKKEEICSTIIRYFFILFFTTYRWLNWEYSKRSNTEENHFTTSNLPFTVMKVSAKISIINISVSKTVKFV